ncbi:tetratricopeptide repeat protein [Micromonospora phytophila]|uniref:ATP-binding protein n=1 Tax=Micromonospora phytophila TaxID=709888 RepID=UPI00202FD293|nr:tetratricopeptide repeat protein [Micromonospora phytophila]MCM0674201.1 tetratricopeptide repeat protein [Micromonospora phytophila]
MEPGSWLPRAVPDFVGRTETIARLTAETRRIEDHASVVHVIDGMAGSGKTTLAVQLARREFLRYPDAQLFIDLRGHGDRQPVEAAAALATLLRQLGVPGGRIPAELERRIELWRRELAGRRSVVVLDNAASAEQVLPLLPVVPGTVMIVTSRRRLPGLDIGPPESLPLMTTAEGIALLASAAGAERVAAEPAAAAAVVDRCGHLPLAIRLAGSRLAHRPGWRVADLADLLAEGAGGISQLALRDRTVAGAFATSYEPLDESTKRLFRRLSIHPGANFSVPMVAALGRLPLPAAAAALDELVDGHLIEEVSTGQYRMHDLIRQYATELSSRSDPPADRDSSRAELLDFVLHSSLLAAEVLEPGFIRTHMAVGAPRRPDLVEALGPPKIEWLENGRPDLVAMVVCARENGHHEYAWRLARVLWRFCYIRAYFDDIILTHRQGLAAALAVGDEGGTAVMNNYLASAYVRTGDYRGALKHLTAAVAICERRGDRANLFRYRANLVVVYWLRGDLRKAVAVGMECLRDPRGYGPDDVPVGLPNLGLALATLGQHEEALRMHRMHLYWARTHHNYFHILNALSHIGSVKARMGRYPEAVRALRAALALRDRTGHRYAEPEAQNDLGIALRGLGRTDDAVRQHELARKLAVDIGERHVEAAALNDLGLTLAASGARERSAQMHETALRLATRIAHPYEQGRALAGLAEYHAPTDLAEARRHWERALAIFRRMGVPERFDVQRRLAETAETVLRAAAGPREAG